MTRTRVIFDVPMSPWVLGALCLLVLVAVIVLTRRDVARLRPFMRVVLIALTALGALMAAGLLLDPRLVHEWPDPQKPALVLLVDGSRSMLLTDAYKGAEAEWIRGQGVAPPPSAENADSQPKAGSPGSFTHSPPDTIICWSISADT